MYLPVAGIGKQADGAVRNTGITASFRGASEMSEPGIHKLKAGRLGRELTDACLQYWGGMGFMNETPVSRAYRDFRLTSIGGGADEVMLTVLCKMMGTLPGTKGNA